VHAVRTLSSTSEPKTLAVPNRFVPVAVALRHAIPNGELRVHYQPIVDLTSGRVLGHEALVRWQHPTQGLLGPDRFIPIAEESGSIVPLGTWVLREACRQAKRFTRPASEGPPLTMSVNLSGAQMGRRDLLAIVSSALADARLAPEQLHLEMTESILMSDAESTMTILRQLKDRGVQVGIDDFGTGYSSLAYLKRFPVDFLKIDRSFVSGLGHDREDAAIASAILCLANTLGLAVIAEGVETSEQRDCLARLGCMRAQGYLFGRPVDAPHAQTMLDHAAPAPCPAAGVALARPDAAQVSSHEPRWYAHCCPIAALASPGGLAAVREMCDAQSSAER
jgi:EAL domain-containing protein (putative c-di-GMP-specific phosphodiesterase class I)